MVSDDYWYGQKGINLVSVSIQHYLGWSGRLLTDITSRIILQYPAWVISGIKTLALVALIVLIAIIPNMILGKNVFSRVNLYLIFITYWICNPNLGQTTFWTVGASNYLFTNLWIMAYLNLVFFIFHHEKKWYQYIFLIIVSFGAGLSNENTSPILVMFTFGMLIYVIIKRKNYFPWIIGFVFNLFGMLVLLLSPGNKVRVQNLPPDVKSGLSIQNIYNFFGNGTAGKLFSNYGFLFLIFVVVIIFLFFKRNISRIAIFWSLTFFLMAILSNFAFIVSPVMMIRSLQGAFVIFLVSLSFLVTELMRTVRPKIIDIVFFLMMSIVTVLFVASYTLEVNSFKLAREESNVRQSIILNSRKNNKRFAVIPSWYYGTLLRPQNDSYDAFFSPHMGGYYGYKGMIKEVNVPLDYTKKDSFNDYLKVPQSHIIYGVKFVKDNISGKITTMVLLKKINKNNDFNLKINFKDGKSEGHDISAGDAINIHGNKFISTDFDPMYKDNLDNFTIVIKDNSKVKERLVLNTQDVYNRI